MNRLLALLAFFLFVSFSYAAEKSRGDAMLDDYFRNETLALSESCLAEIRTAEDWNSRRTGYRSQLQEMLGLSPMPERTDLKPVVTGKLEHEQFTVEKIQFQASPGLYCTANLFIPKNLTKPAPTILYESGHYRLITNGISYGNKAAYQLDGAWFARNGYACLVLDTLLAGEVQGIHTGTRDRGMWWWNSRGYTPAGVEAWFGIRALDYLCTRAEVDTNRFGITGHSGGGAYSWTVTALDDRIKVAAPLAGMADMQSHILDGVMDSHCDCNFPVNIYRWDFPQLAALAAPRPLLIGGTDNDRLFRLDNTIRIHEKLRRLYQLLGVTNKLGLALAPGPHDEVLELRLAVIRWFNRYLKGIEKEAEQPIVVDAKKFFTPEQIRVFDTLPVDAINTNIADTFVPLAKPGKKSADELRTALCEKVFSGWPADDLPLDPKQAFEITNDGIKLTAWDFISQHDVSLRLYLFESAKVKTTGLVSLTVLDSSGAKDWYAQVRAFVGPRAQFSDQLTGEFAGTNLTPADPINLEKLKREVVEKKTTLAFFAPRGVGLTAFSGDEKALTKIRRRFMLLGQTLDGMRVWDIRRAVQMIHFVRDADVAKVELHASGDAAVNALYAALFEPSVQRLVLEKLPASQANGPDYLGVLRVTDLPQLLEVFGDRAVVR